MYSQLKELVKKRFNLVDAPVETEMTAEQSFGEIKTADGELTLVYEGEELAVELPIFVSTPDGNIPAPDGEHLLEGGVKIETEGGVIKEISKEEEVEIEVEAEEEDKVEMEDEEKMEDVVVEGLPATVAPQIEELISAIAEVVTPMIEEMKKEIEEMKAQFNKTEQKVETFSKAPAVEKTIATIKSKNASQVNVDYKPMTSDKAKQFEYLVKLRTKK